MTTDSTHRPAPPGWLEGGGEMGERVRAFDWAATPLGALATWPTSLRTMVASLLHSRHPMFLWWGPELIQIYNDAYVPSFGVGKHPAALGQPGRDCWPEIWPIIGPQIEDVMQHAKASWHEDALVPIFRNGRIEQVYWTYGYSPVFGDGGRVAGTLVVCTETTGRVLAEQREKNLLAAEQAARQAAEVASRSKDDFLATASHELRTPLNAILGWARMLRSGQLDQSAYLRGVESIERNAQSQVRLIEDILDGSRILNGNLQLEIRPLDMTALVNAALDAVRPAAAAKRIELSLTLEPAAARVVGDPERLQQVVWNLVSNAIKFTPKGGSVEVSLRRVGTDIELRVVDSGQGISAEFLPHVFERFRQAEGSTTRRHGGLGLGLALVQYLTEAHGGRVRAESAGSGQGAAFTVWLPVQAVYQDQARRAERATAGEAPTAARPSLAGITALVVDDEADARDLVATVLRANGAEVTIAPDAARALELIAAGHFMVMVSDVGMPMMDGYALIRGIRSLTGARGANIPAIALTAYAREEDRRLAVDAGFNTHVAKPVEPDELVRLVAALVAATPRDTRDYAPDVRADVLSKFEKILQGQGIHEALRFLNSRTAHRFTGVYRFEPPLLRSLYLLDADTPALLRGDDPPLDETYCSIVGATEQPFTTENAARDDRLRTHPARETVLSYCGVLLRTADGTPFGSLCHFDSVACDIPVPELRLMEAVAPLIMRALAAEDAKPRGQ